MIQRIGRAQSRLLWAWYPRRNLAISLEWKAADLWIGAYIYTHQPEGLLQEQTDLYLIGIPTLVLHIAFRHYL